MEYTYDHPHVKEVVHAIIAEEMKSFTPATNYLAHHYQLTILHMIQYPLPMAISTRSLHHPIGTERHLL